MCLCGFCYDAVFVTKCITYLLNYLMYDVSVIAAVVTSLLVKYFQTSSLTSDPSTQTSL